MQKHKILTIMKKSKILKQEKNVQPVQPSNYVPLLALNKENSIKRGWKMVGKVGQGWKTKNLKINLLFNKTVKTRFIFQPTASKTPIFQPILGIFQPFFYKKVRLNEMRAVGWTVGRLDAFFYKLNLHAFFFLPEA